MIVGICVRPLKTRSAQISSLITKQWFASKTSIARSSSQRSHTRPVGLCGEQKMGEVDVVLFQLAIHVIEIHAPHTRLVPLERAVD